MSSSSTARGLRIHERGAESAMLADHDMHDARPPFTPEETDRHVEAWSQPGAATGMINYYRSSGTAEPEEGRSRASPVAWPHAG
jgi:hypothetical protein